MQRETVRQAREKEDLAHYSDKVYDVGCQGTRVAEGVTSRFGGFDGADNVTVMSRGEGLRKASTPLLFRSGTKS